MTPLSDVGRKLHAHVRRFFDLSPEADATPLELLQAALDQLERRTEPAGRGARAFPYSRAVVHVAQPGADRTAIEAIFKQLDTRLRERLAELRCELPAGFQSSVAIDESPVPGRPIVTIECSDGEGEATAAADGPAPALRVTVVKGQCQQTEYVFQEGAVAIGRGAEPSDTFGRVRRNQVAFMDARDGVTETVARAHARIEFDPASRVFLLYNESRSNPTFLLRGGRSIRVVPRDPRGVRVQSGDEIQLGRAVVRIQIGMSAG